MIRILQYRLKNPQEFVERSKYEAETKEEVEKYKDISEEEMYRFVVHCVKDHLIIIKYVEDLSNVLAMPMALDFLMFSALICLQLFQLSSVPSDGFELVIICGYIGSACTILLMYYWHSNELSIESLNMCQAAFESPWINSSKRIKNALRLLMARSLKPLVFQAGFYPMNLRAFITILRGAYSAFTVMRQVDK
ncbi:odorant receptor 49b-like [Ctenocephalides felis]|uniref:odorant receptor 49b-like n=1 Tax=Ctenocephalides felis TaxID=7515 RepID=UPI000E6E26FF|nr:odorant receptor 49b-like [Ctenocephalides felis]